MERRIEMNRFAIYLVVSLCLVAVIPLSYGQSINDYLDDLLSEVRNSMPVLDVFYEETSNYIPPIKQYVPITQDVKEEKTFSHVIMDLDKIFHYRIDPIIPSDRVTTHRITVCDGQNYVSYNPFNTFYYIADFLEISDISYNYTRFGKDLFIRNESECIKQSKMRAKMS